MARKEGREWITATELFALIADKGANATAVQIVALAHNVTEQDVLDKVAALADKVRAHKQAELARLTRELDAQDKRDSGKVASK